MFLYYGFVRKCAVQRLCLGEVLGEQRGKVEVVSKGSNVGSRNVYARVDPRKSTLATAAPSRGSPGLSQSSHRYGWDIGLHTSLHAILTLHNMKMERQEEHTVSPIIAGVTVD
uniref:Uncharacterized protein n=1 Tax=Timema bartmani TaxID=61472 RepID=A0A7R9F6I3_9NEOP|nr:unnamed protein product [Timema bartmani]